MWESHYVGYAANERLLQSYCRLDAATQHFNTQVAYHYCTITHDICHVDASGNFCRWFQRIRKFSDAVAVRK